MKVFVVGMVAVAGAAAAAGILLAVGAPHGKNWTLRISSARGLPPAGQAAMETLVAQLQRRFHERTNVDFGFSRVVRPSERIHAGPVASHLGTMPPDLIQTKVIPPSAADKRAGRRNPRYVAIMKDGRTIPTSEYREKMWPENADETHAIGELTSDTSGFAIYTAGAFDQTGHPRRMRGPAYFAQDVPTAPGFVEMAESAKRAWNGQDASASLPGWMLRTVPVYASDASCVNCHQPITPRFVVKNSRSSLKVGDRLGLIVLAYKPRA